MKYLILPMTIDDYDEVVNLWQKTEGMRLSQSDSRISIEKYLKRNPNLSFIARNENNQLIGVVICGHDGARGYVRHLAVIKNYRKLGVGKELLNKCLSGLKLLGIHKATLFILCENNDH